MSIEAQPRKLYISPAEFTAEFKKSKEIGAPTEKLVLMFQKIAKNFSTTFTYVNRCDYDACINFAVSEAWRKWESYDPERSDNIFSFYTTIIANDLMTHYNLLTRGKSVNISIDALFASEKS
jgi:hypothetical protein